MSGKGILGGIITGAEWCRLVSSPHLPLARAPKAAGKPVHLPIWSDISLILSTAPPSSSSVSSTLPVGGGDTSSALPLPWCDCAGAVGTYDGRSALPVGQCGFGARGTRPNSQYAHELMRLSACSEVLRLASMSACCFSIRSAVSRCRLSSTSVAAAVASDSCAKVSEFSVLATIR